MLCGKVGVAIAYLSVASSHLFCQALPCTLYVDVGDGKIHQVNEIDGNLRGPQYQSHNLDAMVCLFARCFPNGQESP